MKRTDRKDELHRLIPRRKHHSFKPPVLIQFQVTADSMGALTLVEKVILESVRYHSPLSGVQTTDEKGRHGTTGLHQSLLIGQSDCRYGVPFS